MIRAGAKNRDMVRGGHSHPAPHRIVSPCVALAVLAGMIAAPLSGDPGMVERADHLFAAAVIGGIGLITGALIGSLLVGFDLREGVLRRAQRIGVYVPTAVILLGCRRADEACAESSCSAWAGSRRWSASPRWWHCCCADLTQTWWSRIAGAATSCSASSRWSATPGRPVWPRGLRHWRLRHRRRTVMPAWSASGAAGGDGRARCTPCSSARQPRTTGVYFIMVMLAFAQMADFVLHDTKRRQRRHPPGAGDRGGRGRSWSTSKSSTSTTR